MGAVLHRGVDRTGASAVAGQHLTRTADRYNGDGTAVEHYLTELGTHLLGPGRARTAILAETRDGLHEAIQRQLTHGQRPDPAAELAIIEFGPPVIVAASFSDELATLQARHTIRDLLLTGPLVGLCWLILLVPRRWPVEPLAVWAAIPILPIVGAGVIVGLIVLVSTGSMTRYLPEPPPPLALLGAAAISVVCLTADLTMLTVLATHLAHHDRLALPLAAIAAILSLIRLAVAGPLVARCVRARRRLAATLDEPLPPSLR